jgi:hypothetical protein
MSKTNIEIVKNWNDNPHELVTKINNSKESVLINDDSSRGKTIGHSYLKFNKFIFVNVGGPEIPIFEGVDKIRISF